MKKKLLSGVSKEPVTEGIVGHVTYTADNGAAFNLDLDSTPLNFQEGDFALIILAAASAGLFGSSVQWGNNGTTDVNPVTNESRLNTYGDNTDVAMYSGNFSMKPKGSGNTLRITNMNSEQWKALSCVVIILRNCHSSTGNVYPSDDDGRGSSVEFPSRVMSLSKGEYLFQSLCTNGYDDPSFITSRDTSYSEIASAKNTVGGLSSSVMVFYKLSGEHLTYDQVNSPPKYHEYPEGMYWTGARDYVLVNIPVLGPFKYTMIAGEESGFLAPGWYNGRYGTFSRLPFGSLTTVKGITNSSTVALSPSSDYSSILTNTLKLNMLVVNGVEYPISDWRYSTSGTIGSRTYPIFSSGRPTYVTGQTYECELKHVP